MLPAWTFVVLIWLFVATVVSGVVLLSAAFNSKLSKIAIILFACLSALTVLWFLGVLTIGILWGGLD